ncbi:YCF48-related protein [Halopseudomonas aestusnigri]|uniref:WD40/YVTN/BNR-like repeat-containing protein n=1 Tax=Halopseudomonas aestusnigri TaxID=857252 RepID=UPI002554C0D1|nr:YCF48-related protein [Halopseudomonas aestusnigri]MDL2199656.1 YCF48-related protein [Halopseudomonas aestusnigri]
MRKPCNWRAPFVARTDLNASGNYLKKGFSLSALTQAVMLSGMMALGAASAHAADVAEESVQPAIKSDLAAHTLLVDAAVAGDRLVAVGSRGHIVYSDDQGKTWTQANVPVRQLLTAVYFADDKNGWAVGHDSLILHTSDAGANWEMQYRDPELDQPIDPEGPSLLERPLMDVWFKNANTGFAIGAYGTFLRTDDGGKTWEDRSYDIDNPDGFHYNAITAVKGAGLMLAGEMGTLYRSPDFGDTWETLTDLPYDGSWFGASGTGSDNVVLVWGLRGNMFRSTDFGDTWEQVELLTPNNGPLEATLLGGGLSGDGKLVVVGAGGVVLSSTDGGNSFDVMTRPDRIALASAKALGDGELLLVGQHGVATMPASALKAH